MSFIRDVLGESLFKKQKKDLLGNQQIVANSISKNKLQNQLEKNENVSKQNQIDVTKDFFLESEVSMTSKHLMKDTKIKKYIIFIVLKKNQKKNFRYFFASRCLKVRFEEFVGCKKYKEKY